MVVLKKVFLNPLCHATENTDNQSALACHGMDGVKSVEDFLLGIVAHAACIEEHGIRLVNTLTHLITGHLHHRGYHLTVCHIHLATVCLNI